MLSLWSASSSSVEFKETVGRERVQLLIRKWVEREGGGREEGREKDQGESEEVSGSCYTIMGEV